MMLLADVERIREERIKKNLSCRKLSLLADLPDNALSRIEARECKTVLRQLQKRWKNQLKIFSILQKK